VWCAEHDAYHCARARSLQESFRLQHCSPMKSISSVAHAGIDFFAIV
jgi:hypothetical protein